MTFADDAFQQFEQYEMPAVLLAIGHALDQVLREHREVPQGTVELRLELDSTSAASIKRHYNRTKSRILEAARAHLLYRERAGLEVRLETFDSGIEMSTPFALAASIVQIREATPSSTAARASTESVQPRRSAQQDHYGPRRSTT